MLERLASRLRRILDIRRGEGRPLAVVALYVATAVASFLLAKPIRNGLFLEEWGADYLAYVYVAVPVALAVFVPLYSAVAARVGTRLVVTGSLLLFAGSAVAFWYAFTYHPAPWLSFAFYVWVNGYGVVAPVQAWTFANAVFDTRQARRLFGLVGAGASIGNIGGGLLARSLVGSLGTVNLLLVLAALIAAAALIVNAGWRVRRRDQVPAGPRRRLPPGEALGLVWRTPYLRRLALLVALVAIVTQWTQFQFQYSVDRLASVAGDADRMTRFFGDFNAVMGGVALLLQVVATGPALRRFGIAVTILVLPLSLGAGVGLVAITGALWAVLAASALDQGLRFSIDKATFELLYLPIASGVKSDVKATIDLVVNRLADGAGGILLGLATTGFTLAAVPVPGLGLGLRGVAAINLLFIAAWAAVALAVRRGYVETIRESIQQHQLDAARAAAPVLDRSTSDLLAARLSAENAHDILYALNLFRIQHARATHPAVRGLLRHPDAAVRERAVEILNEAGDRTVAADVETLVADPDPAVRAAALLYLAHHARVDPLTRIGAVGDVPDYAILASLVAFLGRDSEWRNPEAAHTFLWQMIESPETRVRLEAARLLRVLDHPEHEALARLLGDPDPDVVRAALAAAGQPRYGGHAASVLAWLDDPRQRAAAEEALARMGEAAVPGLRAVLEQAAAPLPVRRHVPAILAAIATPEAAEVLLDHLFGDERIRGPVIAALGALRARRPGLRLDAARIRLALTYEILRHYASYQTLGRLGRALAADDPVMQGLRESMDQEEQRIFDLLGLLRPDADVPALHAALRSPSRTARANALELLSYFGDPQLRELLVPLLDGDLAERARTADRIVGFPIESDEDAVRGMLASESPWRQAWGVQAAARLRLRALVPEITRLLERSDDPLLRESAREALAIFEAPAAAAARPAAEAPAVEAVEAADTFESTVATPGVG
jgi:AAA family ATP:ADP antiporter